MSETTNRLEHASQCLIDREMLRDVHLVICGSEHMGIVGLKDSVPALRRDVDALLLAKAETMSIGRAAAIVGGFIVGVGAVATAIVVVFEFIHNLNKGT